MIESINHTSYMEVDIERMINEYGDSLLRMCTLYVKDRYLAEDIMQETFIKVYRKYHLFNHDANEKTWITSIAINTCKNHMRGSWFNRVKTQIFLESTSSINIETELVQAERDRELLEKVMGLKVKYREVILLYYYQEMTVKDIAEILHIKEGTVRVRLQRAREQLGEQLQEVKQLGRCKVAIGAGLLSIMCLFTGTSYAITHVEGFSQFMDQIGLEKLGEHIQTVNQSSVQSDVRLVVEEAITNQNNTMIVFSLINEGNSKWQWSEEVAIDDCWIDNINALTTHSPIMSKDGKKITYYVEGASTENLNELKNLTLEVKNIIEEKVYEENVGIDLKGLIENQIVEKVYGEGGESDSELVSQLKKKLQQTNKGSNKTILDSETQLKFEYAGFIEKENEEISEGGLVLYIRNKHKDFARGKIKEYKFGYISEVTDTRTGEVYHSNGYTVRDDYSIFEGGVATSIFPDIQDESILPYLRITKITYKETNILVRDTWKVDFKLKQDEALMQIPIDIPHTENGQTVHMTGMTFSDFGVTLEGSVEGRLIDTSKDSATDTLEVILEMKDGTQIPLVGSSGGTNLNQYSATYSTSMETIIWDIDEKEIRTVWINKQKVSVN